MNKSIVFLSVFLLVASAVYGVELKDSSIMSECGCKSTDAGFKEMSSFISTFNEKPSFEAFSMEKSRRSTTCSDTDGGINEFEVGTVSGQAYGFPYSFTDFCSPCDENKLVEFYCKNGDCTEEAKCTGDHCDRSYPKFKVITCENGCTDGECNEPNVPEFGLVAGSVAILGSGAGYLFLRRKR